MNTRREFFKLASLAGLSQFGAVNALAQASDYKALVCIFMFGGNDGNNLIVPKTQSEYNAYKAARGSLALPDGNAKLLPISAAEGPAGPPALPPGLALPFRPNRLPNFWLNFRTTVSSFWSLLICHLKLQSCFTGGICQVVHGFAQSYNI